MNNINQIKDLLSEVIKLSDGKIVININFFNTSDAPATTSKPDHAGNPERISVSRAAQIYDLSEGFFFSLARHHPELVDRGNNMQYFFNRDLLEAYLAKHPEHKIKSQSQRA